MREHVGGEEEEKGETRSRKKDIHVVLDACQDMPFSPSLIYMVFVLFFSPPETDRLSADP